MIGLSNKRGLVTMDKKEKFWNDNLSNKINMLQDEHKRVLEVIYKDACDRGHIVDFEKNPSISQAMEYADIRNGIEQEISEDVLNVCLTDLEKNAFITNISAGAGEKYKYTITLLGVEYFKKTLGADTIKRGM